MLTAENFSVSDFNWDKLNYWQSGEWQVVEERLDDLSRRGVVVNPKRDNLFTSLNKTPYNQCRCILVGQDPYPDPKYCTGLAFSIPNSLRKYPPTLTMVLKELKDDLGVERKNGSLESWTKQGVLLWNAIPSCLSFSSLSQDWLEWQYLTKEIIEKLCYRGVVFVFLGTRARYFAQYVTGDNNAVVEVGHPSPRGNMSARVPFTGSRIFSTVNDLLVNLGSKPIDWSK